MGLFSKIARSVDNFFLKRIYQPDIWAIFFNDSYFIRKGIYNGIKHYSKEFNGKLLDFGCGRKPYRNLFHVDEYIGIDLKREDEWTKQYADVLYDGTVLPFQDHYFDGVLSTEVIEHLPNEELAIQELYRILKPGGRILITVPFVWNEHGVPYDYRRYTSFGISELLKKYGFSDIQVRKNSTFIETLVQLWCIYLVTFLNTRFSYLNMFLNFLFISPFILVGVIFSAILPANRTLFINTIVYARKH